MLSKANALRFFFIGTVICFGFFIMLTIDTFKKIPAQTNAADLTDSVKRGKTLWENNNCMGCHTLLGEGAYYAPELTKVYNRRGGVFIKSMLTDPAAMYPGDRKMVQYRFTEDEQNDIVEFFKWIGNIDTNGFPADPPLARFNGMLTGAELSRSDQILKTPKIFSQTCLACHSLQGRGGAVGPALDGVGDKRDEKYLSLLLKDPKNVNENAIMPKLPLTDEEIEELVAFLSQLKGGE